MLKSDLDFGLNNIASYKNTENIMNKKLHIILLILSCATMLHSQNLGDTTLDLRMVLRSKTNHNLIRLAPVNYHTFLAGQQGYRLERRILEKNGVRNDWDAMDSSLVVIGPITPVPYATFMQKYENQHLIGELAGDLIHFGDSIYVERSTDPFLDYDALQDKKRQHYLYSLIAADLDFEVACDMGLGIIDSMNVTEGEDILYEYRVQVYDTTSQTYENRYYTLFNTADEEILYTPIDMYAKESLNDSTVYLSWYLSPDVEQYVHYEVYRSKQENTGFEAITDSELPMINASTDLMRDGESAFRDTDIPSVAPNNKYYYFVRGKSIFGEWGPPSDTVKVQFPPPMVDFGLTVDTVFTLDSTLYLSWQINDQFEPFLSHFEIKRSDNYNGPFDSIPNGHFIDKTKREFIDIDPHKQKFNTYNIYAVDLLGRSLHVSTDKYLFKDSIPPGIPQNIRVAIDDSGVATISWTPNTEEDILGYRVFYANSKYADYFPQLTTKVLKDTVFQTPVNLNTLTEQIYFRVAALDVRENMSDKSPLVVGIKPDIVPPAKPGMAIDSLTDGSISFRANIGEHLDVEEYRLLRKEPRQLGWDTIATFEPIGSYLHFSDPDAAPNKLYEYRLLAIDDAGNRSSSAPIKARSLFLSVDEVAYELEVAPSSIDDELKLDWKFDGPIQDVEGFQIYKKINDYASKKFRFIPAERCHSGGNSYTFSFHQIELGRNLEFVVRPKYKGGVWSDKSIPVRIEY